MGRPASAPPGPQQFSSAATSLPGDAGDPSQYPFWNVRRYRPYFDVDTKVGEACCAVLRSLSCTGCPACSLL